MWWSPAGNRAPCPRHAQPFQISLAAAGLIGGPCVRITLRTDDGRARNFDEPTARTNTSLRACGSRGHRPTAPYRRRTRRASRRAEAGWHRVSPLRRTVVAPIRVARWTAELANCPDTARYEQRCQALRMAGQTRSVWLETMATATRKTVGPSPIATAAAPGNPRKQRQP